MNLIYNEDFFAEIVNDFYYMFDRVLNTPLNSVANTVEKMIEIIQNILSSSFMNKTIFPITILLKVISL